MDQSTILEKVASIIERNLDFKKNEVTLETDFESDLGADSLDVMNIVIEIEGELDISLRDEDVSKINNVGDLVELIEKKFQ